MILRPMVLGTLLNLGLTGGLIPDFLIPQAVQRWLASPRVKTARGVEAFDRKDYEGAVKPMQSALADAPEDSLRQFNAGTAELAAGQAKDSLPLLEEAARGLAGQGAGAELTADALYNLGNGRLASGDAAGAVEAYKQALRTRPDHADAKHNLELALKQLEEERQAKQKQESPNGKEQGDQEQSQNQGQGEQSDQQPRKNPQSQPDQGQNQQQAQNQQDGQQPQPQPGQGQQPSSQRLPNFAPQPDMTADQAAALLESVENLEREARRAEALARAAERKTGERDW
jgi:Ca-activated chloride channel family protein